MKKSKSLLSEKRVKEFEQEQIDMGTEAAMSNLIWDLLFEAFGFIGVKSVKTKYRNEFKDYE